MKKQQTRIGLVQLYEYNLDIEGGMQHDLRTMVDGESLQVLVYGEKIRTKELIVTDPGVLKYRQKYRPEIWTEKITAENLEKLEIKEREEIQHRMEEYFGMRAEDVSHD